MDTKVKELQDVIYKYKREKYKHLQTNSITYLKVDVDDDNKQLYL